MNKKLLKQKITENQNGVCALTQTPLALNQSLNDTDRVRPKTSGGIYLLPNTRVVNPRAHMLRHGILRTRTEIMDEIKSVFDDRLQTMRLKNKINNQLLAYRRRVDTVNPETEAFLEKSLEPIEARLARIDANLKKLIGDLGKRDPLAKTALAVPGIGEITIAALAVYVDLQKADTPSALWKYTGLHCSSSERYTKGMAGGGNQTLRTVLWTSADSLMKGKNGYRAIYDHMKNRLAVSEKITNSRNTEGKLVESKWRDTKPSHRHGAALRAIMKQLLADYWLIGRELAGLPLTTPYVNDVLGHKDISPPTERGWIIAND